MLNTLEKTYWKLFKGTPEFVVMFIPGETFLYAALQVDSELIEFSMRNNVIIATPSTLLALLKAVARGWNERKVEENALQIQKLGTELYDRLIKMTHDIAVLGKSIGKSVTDYNTFLGSFERRVLVSTRKFGELGPGAGKTIEAPEKIDLQTKNLEIDEEEKKESEQ